jgi:uncharacterized integral membrane protein
MPGLWAPKDGHPEHRGTGIYWGVVGALVLAVGILIAIVGNLQGVEFHYTSASIRTPLIVILLVTVVATVALTEAVGVVWRRRRRWAMAARARLREGSRGARANVPPVPAPPPPPPPPGPSPGA